MLKPLVVQLKSRSSAGTQRRRGVIGAALLALTACQTYSPEPLITDPVVLSAPLAAVLARDAATLDRPYLRPIALDFSKPLDANAIGVLAVIGNPDLRAMRVRANVADAQLFSARLLPDPTLSLGLDQVLAGPPAVDNLTGTLGWAINELRTRGARIAQARAESQRVRLDLAWAEWQTAGKAEDQAARIVGLEHAAAFAEANRRSALSMLDRMMRAAGRGDLPPDQLQAARLSASDASARVRTIEKDLVTARFDLTRLLGLTPDQRLNLAPPPVLEAPLDATALFQLAANQRLDLQALKAGYMSQEAAVRLAIINQFPTLDLSINATRDTSKNLTVGPAVSLTLPLWNRNRGAIAIEKATRSALKAEYDARLYQTRAEIAAAVAALELARAQRAAILAELPAAQRFAQASRRAADRGDIASATAEAAEQALRDKQLLLAQADQDSAEQLVALQLLTGIPMQEWPK